jgi:hypothetical protein
MISGPKERAALPPWGYSTRLIFALVFVSLLVSACQVTGQSDEPVEPGTFDAVARGQITAPDGTPIGDAVVNGRLYFESCADTTGSISIRDYAGGGDITERDGRYEIQYQHPEYRPTACMNIKVYLEPGEAADKDTTVNPDVDLRPVSEPIDTTRVDVVMYP